MLSIEKTVLDGFDTTKNHKKVAFTLLPQGRVELLSWLNALVDTDYSKVVSPCMSMSRVQFDDFHWLSFQKDFTFTYFPPNIQEHLADGIAYLQILDVCMGGKLSLQVRSSHLYVSLP